MQNIKVNYSVNDFERLFIDKSIESLYKNTIDSYRLKLHNPKTLVEELITVTQSSINGILTNNDYVNYTSKELKKLLDENNDELRFTSINKQHYSKILSKAERNNYRLIIQSSKLILKDNQNYLINIFTKLTEIIKSYADYLDDNRNIDVDKKNCFDNCKKTIVVLVDFLYIELINKGFTKQYLYRIIQSIFIHNPQYNTFEENFDLYKNIIEKQDETYTVIFSISDTSFSFKEFSKIDESYTLLSKKDKSILKRTIPEESYDFIERNNKKILLSIRLNTKDYFKAVQHAVNRLSKDLDIFHLGYSNKHYTVDSHCLVVGEKERSKASLIPTNFQIDGYFKSNSLVFNSLLSKIQKLKEKNIDEESFDKILSAIRYYRTGSESLELETKFLNYWIGLEFIFTSFLTEEKTIDRIRHYFPQCHSLIYVKRNLYDYHKTLERLNISRHIPDYDDTFKYLLNHENYQLIIDTTDNQLLKFRTQYYKKWFEEPNKITDVLKKHQDNLIWNITRLYRIRNEIVHNAAIKNGIYTHVSHLKYYLSFMLNSILNFMAESSVDVDNDGKVTIDDYFISQEIIFGALKGRKLKEFLEVDNPNGIFQ